MVLFVIFTADAVWFSGVIKLSVQGLGAWVGGAGVGLRVVVRWLRGEIWIGVGTMGLGVRTLGHIVTQPHASFNTLHTIICYRNGLLV